MDKEFLSYFNRYGFIMMPLILLILLELISTILSSKKTGGKKVLFKNFILNKIAVFIALFLGQILDYVQNYIIIETETSLFLHIDFRIPFGDILALYMIINEAIQICVQLKIGGIKLPSFLEKTLVSFEKKLDDPTFPENKNENKEEKT